MTPIEFGRKVRRVIERGWCQGALARDADGDKTEFNGPYACCWCLVGASCMVGPPSEPGRMPFTYKLLEVIDGDSRSSWNDKPDRTKAEVLAAIDETIARLEKAGCPA